jgi:hypothetical protein
MAGDAPVDQGRIVVVAAGFALWQGGRCVAAARFSDIRRLRAVRPRSADPDALALQVELGDGSLMELRDAAPGFDLFLDRAATLLKGMLPFSAWQHLPAAAGPMVIFEKPKGW